MMDIEIPGRQLAPSFWMGVTDIGRKSECCTGAVTFGIGLIRVSFHCHGTVDVERDMLKICVVDL